MSDLLDSLKMFQQGAQEYAIGNAFREASSAVRDINSVHQNEFDKRQQMQDLGNQLAMHLGGLGASGVQIQTGLQSIQPKALNTPEDYFNQAAQTTRPEAQAQFQAAGKGVQKALADKPLSIKEKEDLKLGYASLLGQQKAQQASLDFQKEQKVADELDKVDESQYRFNNIQSNVQQLRELIKQHGTNVLTGPEGAQMDSLIYQSAVDYAKLVDPATAAREGEVESAKKYMLPVRDYAGLGYSNETAVKMIDQYLVNLEDRLRSQKSAKKGVMQGVINLPGKDAMIMEAQNRIQKQINSDPHSPRIEAMQRAISRAKRGQSNKQTPDW